MGNCAICLEGVPLDHNHIHTTSCNHTFHHQCLAQWLVGHSRCPVCRHNLGDGDDTQEEQEESGNGRGQSTRIIVEEGHEDWLDSERMVEGAMALVELIASQGRIDCGWHWRRRKEDWTVRMRGSGRRQYLLQAMVVDRPGSDSPPHLAWIEPTRLRPAREVTQEIEQSRGRTSSHTASCRSARNRSKRRCTR